MESRAFQSLPCRSRLALNFFSLPAHGNHDLGISFFGSTKGIVTTVAFAGPSGVSTCNAVPTPASARGTIAYPMLRFRRGEYTAEVTVPILAPLLVTGQPASLRSSGSD